MTFVKLHTLSTSQVKNQLMLLILNTVNLLVMTKKLLIVLSPKSLWEVRTLWSSLTPAETPSSPVVSWSISLFSLSSSLEFNINLLICKNLPVSTLSSLFSHFSGKLLKFLLDVLLLMLFSPNLMPSLTLFVLSLVFLLKTICDSKIEFNSLFSFFSFPLVHLLLHPFVL